MDAAVPSMVVVASGMRKGALDGISYEWPLLRNLSLSGGGSGSN